MTRQVGPHAAVASTRRVGRAVAVAVASLALVGGVAACASDEQRSGPGVVGVDEDGAATFEFLIPLGSGERLDAGEQLEIFPAELTAKVGDTIRIVNDDDRGHTVGPFFVGANETLSQRFASAGVFEGVCTVHPSGQVVLTVEGLDVNHTVTGTIKGGE